MGRYNIIMDQIKELEELKRMFNILYYDRRSCFYKCNSITFMVSKVDKEINRLSLLSINVSDGLSEKLQ